MTVADRASCAVTATKSIAAGGEIFFHFLAFLVTKMAPSRPTSHQISSEGEEAAILGAFVFKRPGCPVAPPSDERSTKPRGVTRNNAAVLFVMTTELAAPVTSTVSVTAPIFP